MNVAFLVLTAAFAPADSSGAPVVVHSAPAAPMAAPIAAPAASPCGVSGGCGTSCNSCESICYEKEGLLTRLRNRFSSLGGNSCDPCAESFGSKLRGRLSGMFRRHNDCDACAPSCGCATSGCATGGCAGTVLASPTAPAVIGTPIAAPISTPAPAVGGESIGAPKEDGAKKLPVAPGGTPAKPTDGAKPLGGKVQLSPAPLSLTPTSARSPF